ncbi:hypothetical protein [Mesobacillus boroniphilus]|uniref:Uncharacterized protein n=1 Tax=Mesobacillus boroniphilus JCM 21738 TaxID=1294265 RepID=W4RLZ4_9BACI|nr:hypothetical protein [Mesobacillus boroniphilus]GAE44903.1 hypothetical protein JCM21738_1654 [Mesobacillus boroniphilus JCM 21738]
MIGKKREYPKEIMILEAIVRRFSSRGLQKSGIREETLSKTGRLQRRKDTGLLFTAS